MNCVAFVWDQEAVAGLGAIQVKVDDRYLAEIIREVELPHAESEGHPNIAGAYAGLRRWQLAGSLAEHFMGADGSDLACGAAGKTVLLGCECGEPGCWPLLAEVDVLEDQVVWRSFEQPHRRGEWSYAELPELLFDRGQYEAALHEAESAAPAPAPPRPE